MNTWHDKIISEKCSLPMIFTPISLATILYCLYMSIYLIFQKYSLLSYVECFIIIIFSFFMFYMFITSIVFFIERKHFVKEISINKENIKIVNGFSKNIILHVKEIILNDANAKKWILFKPYYYISDNNSSFIIISGCGFYRISPNIENIDELKEVILNKMQAVS